MKKVNERAETEQEIVVLQSSDDAIPKEEWHYYSISQKRKKNGQVSDSIFFNFIEETRVNICIWHNRMAECSKNNIQCLTRTFHPDILKPFTGVDKVHYPPLHKIEDSRFC